MRSYLDFEKPVAELEAKIDELRALETGDSAAAIRRGDRPPGGQGGTGAQRPLCRAHALAEDPSRPPPRAAPLPRLCRRPDHRLRAAVRRPQVRRRPRDRRRLRPLPRREHLHHRPREGLVDRKPAQAQFRHGAAGGLSQGGAADADGRPLRHSGAVAGRHRRAPIPASGPRNAARPRLSHARPTPASTWGYRTSRSSSAKAARAAPSPLPPPTGC